MDLHAATPKTVAISVLGGFRMEVDQRVLTDEINRSQKIWNVLAYLVMHRERSVPQTELISLFWSEEGSTNPGNALKTLLYRIRALLEPLFGPGVEPILAQRGAYCWNRAISCTMDTDGFLLLCRQAEDESLPDKVRLGVYRSAIACYTGDFIPKLASEPWTVPLTTEYHGAYLRLVKSFALFLEGQELFEEESSLCLRASKLDPLDEQIHILIVRSLLRQGKDNLALTHYDRATECLYRNLGVRPSAELRALYIELMDMEKSLETDLGVVQEDLREAAACPGAFVCEYGFFKDAYRLEARRAARNGTSVQIALVTVTRPDGSIPELKVLSATMEQLQAVLVRNLRRGDALAKYSGAQYVVMLPAANLEDSTMVMERVVSAFYRQHRRNFLKLSYKIRALD